MAKAGLRKAETEEDHKAAVLRTESLPRKKAVEEGGAGKGAVAPACENPLDVASFSAHSSRRCNLEVLGVLSGHYPSQSRGTNSGVALEGLQSLEISAFFSSSSFSYRDNRN